MFDIGFWEVLILATLGLLILGPERLPRVVSKIGRWVGAARRTANQLRWQIERELDMSEREEKAKKSGKPKNVIYPVHSTRGDAGDAAASGEGQPAGHGPQSADAPADDGRTTPAAGATDGDMPTTPADGSSDAADKPMGNAWGATHDSDGAVSATPASTGSPDAADKPMGNAWGATHDSDGADSTTGRAPRGTPPPAASAGAGGTTDGAPARATGSAAGGNDRDDRQGG